MADIVPYKEQKLERIPAAALIRPEHLHLSRFFLPGSVYVGQYNQVGFVLVDRTPGKRPWWIGSDILYYDSEEVEKDIRTGRLREDQRWFYDMQYGMSALRYFAISDELMEIFRRDTFLGVHVIEKICEEGLVPPEFEEYQVYPTDSRQRIDCYDTCDDRLEITKVVEVLLAPLRERTGTEYKLFSYVTYFPAMAYPVFVPVLETAVQEAVARFDQFGNKYLGDHPGIRTNLALVEANALPE